MKKLSLFALLIMGAVNLYGGAAQVIAKLPLIMKEARSTSNDLAQAKKGSAEMSKYFFCATKTPKAIKDAKKKGKKWPIWCQNHCTGTGDCLRKGLDQMSLALKPIKDHILAENGLVILVLDTASTNKAAQAKKMLVVPFKQIGEAIGVVDEVKKIIKA